MCGPECHHLSRPCDQLCAARNALFYVHLQIRLPTLARMRSMLLAVQPYLATHLLGAMMLCLHASVLKIRCRNLMWVQFLTSAFCHHDFNHLSSNAFMLYVFGRIVEEEEGAPGVWGTYLVCALGEFNSSRILPSFTGAAGLGSSIIALCSRPGWWGLVPSLGSATVSLHSHA